MKKMRIAIIGQGRSGRDIHGKFFRSESNDFCQVVCIVEADAARRERAREEFGCDVLEDYTQLFGRKDIDLVVNATYSQLHYSITKALLQQGFHVLTEKPMGRTYWECMDLVQTAKDRGVIVAAFHQSLYAPHFLKLKEIIAQGTLGEIFQINLKYSSFARRWDWQTLQACCAGSVYNSGPHPFGQALDLLDWDPQTRVAFSSLRRILTSGDSDDCGKTILTAPGKPVVDIEVNSADAYAGDYVIKVFGSKGTLRMRNNRYEMKYVEDFSVYPERPVIRGFMSKEDGTPAYCGEKLDFVQKEEVFEGSVFDIGTCTFYKMMYNSVMLGQPLEIPPEHAAQVISMIETCHAQNPLPVMFV